MFTEKTHIKNLQPLGHYYTQQFDWSQDSHGWGAMTAAAYKIAAGDPVSFYCFKRGESSTDMIYQKQEHFGLVKFDDEEGTALRTGAKDLTSCGSHSIIPTWYGNKAKDPVCIAAAITSYLRCYSDCFIV